MRPKTAIPLAILSAAAIVLPAAAGAQTIPNPPYPLIPVPPGEVQHTVIETTFKSNEIVPGVTPWRRVEDLWASAHAARSVFTNGEDGELESECASTTSTFSCFYADNHDAHRSGSGGPMVAAGRSWETKANNIKEEIAKGPYRLIGTTSFLGRPAQIYSGPQESEGQTTLVVDDATGYPLQESVSFTYGTQTGTQVSTVTAFEALRSAAASAELTPREHPGANASRRRRDSKRRSHRNRPHTK